MPQSSEQKRWPGMPEKILNMDWEELLDLIQEIRSGLKESEDSDAFAIGLAKTLDVDITTPY